MTPLSTRQNDQLLTPIHPDRVLFKRGLAYLEAYEVKAHLNRIFGFAGWSQEVIRYQLHDRTQKGRVQVWCDALVRLTVAGATYTDAAVGSESGPADELGSIQHLALTAAIASAFKRAAVNLGDQFGLSLYGDGSLEPIVRHTVDTDDGDVQRGSRPASEEVTHARQDATRALRDLAAQTGVEPAKIAARFEAIHDVPIGQAHPAQILDFTERLRHATS